MVSDTTTIPADFQEIYEEFFPSLYKMAFFHVKKPADAADITQEVFLKYLISSKKFQSADHRRAWLLTCTHNACMDYFRSRLRKNVSLEKITAAAPPFTIDETLGALLQLPDKYKTPLYLYYYEGYQTKEIAQMLKKPHATLRVNLSRGRELLKKRLEEKENPHEA